MGGFLGLLETLMKVGWPLLKNFLQPSAKSVLIPLGLGLTAATAAAGDTEIHKKNDLLRNDSNIKMKKWKLSWK